MLPQRVSPRGPLFNELVHHSSIRYKKENTLVQETLDLSSLRNLFSRPASGSCSGTRCGRSTQIETLQKKLDNLQSEMAEVQDELKRLSSASSKAPGNTAELQTQAGAQQGEAKTQAEAELTPKQEEIGKTTAIYRTFSQDPLAAPRINNETA